MYYGPAYFGPAYFGDAFFGAAEADLEPGTALIYVPGDPLLTDGLGTYVEGEVAPQVAQDLLEAIWAFADADAGLEAAFGRTGWLWIGKGARGVPLPYAVLFEVGTAPVGLTSSEIYHENVAIQFNIFATTEPEAKRLGLMILDLFAPYQGQDPMEFEDGTDLGRWIGDGNVLERELSKGKGGVAVYVQRINYVWRIGRSYAPA